MAAQAGFVPGLVGNCRRHVLSCPVMAQIKFMYFYEYAISFLKLGQEEKNFKYDFLKSQ